MDLGAYAKISDLQNIMNSNNIYVPRLRGLRLMRDEKPLSEEQITKESKNIGLINCEFLIEGHFKEDPDFYEISDEMIKRVDKYILKDEKGNRTDVNWDAVPVKKRKLFHLEMQKADKAVREQYRIFNKYCGHDDVLYIHARIGGMNWRGYDGQELMSKSWFLEKVDDAFDPTYCDIYARIKPIVGYGIED